MKMVSGFVYVGLDPARRLKVECQWCLEPEGQSGLDVASHPKIVVAGSPGKHAEQTDTSAMSTGEQESGPVRYGHLA
jgi:hypothetical protein